MRVELASDAHRDIWNEFVSTNEKSSYYHLYEWRYVFENTYNYRSHYLFCAKDGMISGILPMIQIDSIWGRYLSSLPGGICSTSRHATEELIFEATSICDSVGADYLQLRDADTEYSCNLLSTRRQEFTYRVELPNHPSKLWENIRSEARNRVRKALKNELTASWGTSETNVRTFYNIYKYNMRDLGTPSISLRFFLNMVRYNWENLYILLVSRKDGKAIAAMLVFSHNDTASDPFVASLRSESQLAPNDLLYWEALRWATEQGFDVFDLGRSEPNSGNARFKEKWSATACPLYYQFYPKDTDRIMNPRVDRRYQLLKHVWPYLPINVATWLSPIIRKHVPLG